jgi:hypothetical protein
MPLMDGFTASEAFSGRSADNGQGSRLKGRRPPADFFIGGCLRNRRLALMLRRQARSG